MPVYTYRCDSCGVQFERHQSFQDAPLRALSRVTIGMRPDSYGSITASCSRHFCASGGVLV